MLGVFDFDEQIAVIELYHEIHRPHAVAQPVGLIIIEPARA
jgi:hypothetical protein